MSKRNTKTEASGLASPAKRTRRVKTKPSAADKRARATERIKAKARCKRRENVMLLMPFINSDLRDKKGKRICGRDW
jgi:hypothetical protein